MKTVDQTWKSLHLTRIENVHQNYPLRAQKIIQPNYIREVVERITNIPLSDKLLTELNTQMDRLYSSIPSPEETAPTAYKTYRTLLDDFKYFINTEFDLLPLHYYKSIYIPIGIIAGLIIGLIIGLSLSSPNIGYLVGAGTGGTIGYFIGKSKDIQKGIHRRFSNF